MGDGMLTGSVHLQDRAALARAFGEIAVIAGRDILRIRAHAIEVRTKADASPVTDADEQAEAVILGELEKICAGIPVAAEEAIAGGKRPVAGNEFLLVDPLDGTREFVAGLDEFTVNIALINHGFPVAGVVYAPATAQLWCGASGIDGHSRAWSCHVADAQGRAQIGAAVPIQTRPFLAASATALVSRANSEEKASAFIRSAGITTVRPAGSSLKFCLIAEGLADVYPRFGPTNEWDIAAGDAVLRAAGGIVLRTDGLPLVYGNPGFGSPHFIAFGDRAAGSRLTAEKTG